MRIIKIKKIQIRKRTLLHWMALYLFLMPFLLNAIQAVSGSLSVVKYTLDVVWIGLTFISLARSKVFIRRRLLPMLWIVLLFLLYTFVIYGFRFQSVFYYLWGLRNNFRFYAAFFIFADFLDEWDIERCFKIIEILFWVNIIVSLFQFLVLGYRWDYLGGIFGTEVGGVSSTLLFFCIVLSMSILQMMTSQRKTLSCIAQLMAATVIAALAEIKAFFLILAVILLVSAILTKFSWKKCLLILIMVICLSLGSSIMVSIFGAGSKLSLENILNLIFADSYASKNDLSRMSSISTLSSTILKDPLSRWIGLGLGNCDSSAFAICNTPFYQNHSRLHYNWFSIAFLFLETGYWGLVLYASFLITCMISAAVQIRRKSGNILNCQLTIIMAVVCLILFVYNSSLRMDIGYIAYFVLAAPFVRKGQKSAMLEVETGGSHHV